MLQTQKPKVWRQHEDRKRADVGQPVAGRGSDGVRRGNDGARRGRRLPRPSHPAGCAVSRRGRHGPDGPGAGARAGRQAWPGRRGGKPGRSRGRDRRGGRGQRRARRLYLAVFDDGCADHQPIAVRQIALRPAKELRADLADQPDLEPAGGESGIEREFGGRTGGAGQAAAGRADVQFVGQWHHQPSGG
ncbi:hypothetical protein D3C73_969190 [compost metagenome]